MATFIIKIIIIDIFIEQKDETFKVHVLHWQTCTIKNTVSQVMFFVSDCLPLKIRNVLDVHVCTRLRIVCVSFLLGCKRDGNHLRLIFYRFARSNEMFWCDTNPWRSSFVYRMLSRRVMMM